MKKISVILLFALLFSVLVSCANDNNNATENQPNVPNNQDEDNLNNLDEIDNTPEKILPNVPDDVDFDGYEFTILANSTSYNSHWYSRDIYVEEENGETINDAVYSRNRAIEEKYNITIKGSFSASQYNDARRSVQSGDNSFDVLSIPLQGATANLAREGMLLDLKNVPYVDLEQPWWDQKANEQLSIENRVLFTISDLLVIDKDALFIFLFNKDVIQEYGLEDPYQLVRDGTWTIDKLWDMAKVVTRDINGDGVMDDNDAYGLISQTHTMHGNVVSSGHFVITKDNNDMPIINIQDPMIMASYQKWIEILNDRTNTIIAQDWNSKYTGDTIWDHQLDVLNEKRGLWLYTGMNRVTMLREMECNFGILPNPKYDESQSDYYNAVHAWCTTSVSIPITSDPERTGMILEALTSESYYTLRPAYYDISLKSKLMRDDESGEMLDLIFKTRSYDLGHVYNWGGVFDMFGNLAQQRSTDFVSGYERILPRIETDMQKAIDNFQEIN